MIDNKLYVIRLLELKDKLLASGAKPEYILMHPKRREKFNKAIESSLNIPKPCNVKISELADLTIIPYTEVSPDEPIIR